MRVNRSDLDAFADRTETSALVTPAFACLRLTSPNLTLSYPSDAEAHFIELQHELAEFWTWRPMRSQPGGPAYVELEDAWHMHFSTLYKAARGGSLPHIFGPYIPLFICWYCQPRVFDVKLVPTLRRVLRPSVLYITVSISDDGISGTSKANTNKARKLFYQAREPPFLISSPHISHDAFAAHSGLPEHSCAECRRLRPCADSTLEVDAGTPCQGANGVTTAFDLVCGQHDARPGPPDASQPDEIYALECGKRTQRIH